MKVSVCVYRVLTEEVEVEVDIPDVPKLAGTSLIDYARLDAMAGEIAIEKVKGSHDRCTPIHATYEAGGAMISGEEIQKYAKEVKEKA
jgi:hypothetical protein